MTNHSTIEARAYAAWLAVCLVWGTTYLAIRIALAGVPPFLMAAIRFTLAGAILVVFLKARRERIPPLSSWPSLGALGVLLVGCGNGGVVWAEQTVPSGLTAVLVAAIPFWMVAVEFVLGTAEPLSARRLLGLLIGFAGIVLLVWPELRLGSGRPFLVGVLSTQLACLGWAIGSSYARRRDAEENVLGAAAVQMMLGGMALLVVSTALGEWSALALTRRTLVAMAYLTVIGSVAGFSAYAYALKHLPVSTVSLYAYVNPVIAVALGTIILGEPFGLRIAAADGVVLLGMALVRPRAAH